jgi:2-polyprenyl-3-methyl-5-hydroxy-6-metoxy-1,4-benzoquinol methylase
VKPSEMETLKNCPVCNHSSFKEFLSGKDHFLTRENFFIVECNSCGFRFTNPRPEENLISAYYDSPDYIAHGSSTLSPLQVLYKTARKFALRGKFSLVKKYSKGANLLDIGCGTGEFLHYCSKKGFTVTGIEPNEKARKFATDVLGLKVLDTYEINSLPENSFDFISMWHVLEHVHDLSERMDLVRRILTPDGILLIAVPNSNSWDAKHYNSSWAAFDLPRHLYHFTPSTMKRLLEKTGFSLLQTIPLKIDSFYISLLSEKYLRGRQNFFKAFINGFRSNLQTGKEKNYSSLIYICKINAGLK